MLAGTENSADPDQTATEIGRLNYFNLIKGQLFKLEIVNTLYVIDTLQVL